MNDRESDGGHFRFEQLQLNYAFHYVSQVISRLDDIYDGHGSKEIAAEKAIVMAELSAINQAIQTGAERGLHVLLTGRAQKGDAVIVVVQKYAFTFAKPAQNADWYEMTDIRTKRELGIELSDEA